MSFDLVTLGEAMLRLWVGSGERLADTRSLRVSVAGAEANVAVAVARMGRSAAWVSRLPDSVLGRRVAQEIAGQGVDVSRVQLVQNSRLGTYFVELGSRPRPTRVIYDRARSAASELSVQDVPWELVESAGVIHLTGITPALSASCREMTLEVARRAQSASVPVTVDVNYRSAIWGPEEARQTLGELCSRATVLILAERDVREVFGLDDDPRSVITALQDRFGVEHVVVTRGQRGSVWRLGGVEGETPAFEAHVVDRIGVGDTFAAGVILGLLEGDLPGGIQRGTAMAALKLGMEGDQFRGDADDVAELLGRAEREVIR